VEHIQNLEEPLRYRFVDYQVFRKSLHFIQVLRMFYVSSGSREKLDCIEVGIVLVDFRLEKSIRTYLCHLRTLACKRLSTLPFHLGRS
jgi:hypothetical protein